VPKAALSRRSKVLGQRVSLLDHLVGAGYQRGRNREAKCPGGFEIYDEFEFRRLFNGDVRRLCTFQDFIDLAGSMAIDMRKID
jgi:hypothetical protein